MGLINSILPFLQKPVVEDNFNLVRNNKLIASYHTYYDYYNVMDSVTQTNDKIYIAEGRYVIDRELSVSNIYSASILLFPRTKNITIEGVPKKTIFEYRSDIGTPSVIYNSALGAHSVTIKNVIFDMFFKPGNTYDSGILIGYAFRYNFINCVFRIHYSNYLALAGGNGQEIYVNSNLCKNCTFVSDVNYIRAYSDGTTSMQLDSCIFNKKGYLANVITNTYGEKNIDLNTYKCTDSSINNIAGVYSGENAWEE